METPRPDDNPLLASMLEQINNGMSAEGQDTTARTALFNTMNVRVLGDCYGLVGVFSDKTQPNVLMIQRHGWAPEHFEVWSVGTVIRVLRKLQRLTADELDNMSGSLRVGTTGQEERIPAAELKAFLEAMLPQWANGLDVRRAFDRLDLTEQLDLHNILSRCRTVGDDEGYPSWATEPSNLPAVLAPPQPSYEDRERAMAARKRLADLESQQEWLREDYDRRVAKLYEVARDRTISLSGVADIEQRRAAAEQVRVETEQRKQSLDASFRAAYERLTERINEASAEIDRLEHITTEGDAENA